MNDRSQSNKYSRKRSRKTLRLETRYTEIRKVVPETDDPGSESSSSSESESEVDMTSSAPEAAEAMETAEGDMKDFSEDDDDLKE